MSTIRNTVVVFLIGALFFISIFGITNTMFEKYSVQFQDENVTALYNKVNSSTVAINDLSEDLSGKFEEAPQSGWSVIEWLFNVATGIPKTILSSLTTITSVFPFIANLIGIPTYFVTIGTTIIVLTFVIAVAFFISKGVTQ